MAAELKVQRRSQGQAPSPGKRGSWVQVSGAEPLAACLPTTLDAG